MKDYSNYYSSFNDKIVADAKEIFNLHLDGLEGTVGLIDGVENKFVFQKHTNSLNQFKGEYYIMCDSSINLKLGSIIKTNDKSYIVNSEVESTLIYSKALIQECKYNLKWIDKMQVSRELPCIKSNTSLLTKSTKYMTLPANETYILTQDNEFTRTIEADYRFIIGRKVYKVDSWDDNIGLIEFKMTEVLKDEKDNFSTNIAWNPWFGINTYNPIETEGYSVEFVNPSNYIYKNKTMNFSCIFKNNGTIISKQSNFYITADDNISPTLLATITSQDNTNNTCTIKVSDKSGYIKLHVESLDKTITCDPIRIQIKSII